MSIWNKVLIGLIAVASLAFLYMAMRTLKTHQYWRDLARKHEQRITATEEENRILKDGEGEGETAKPGIDQLKVELDKLLAARGRVWFGANPQIGPQAAQTGQVAVTIEQPSPHGISDKTGLYIFEENAAEPAAGAQPRRYLGHFKATQVNDKQVQLEPAAKLDPDELDRLAKSKGPWTLYEIMPMDNHAVFAGLSEAELKKLLPPQTAAEYAKDGQPATKDDLEKWGVRGKVVDDSGKEVAEGKPGDYQRQLRDYEAMIRYYHVQRSIMADRIASAEADKAKMLAARDDAELQRQFRENEKGKLDADKKKFTRERDLVLRHQQRLQERLTAFRDSIARLITSNQAIAGQIAKIQLEAARKIDERTRAMAPSGGARR